MNYVIYEDQRFTQLLPLVYFRPVWELRCGAQTLAEKIRRCLNGSPHYLARPYLHDYYLTVDQVSANLPRDEQVHFINGRWLFNTSSSQLLNSITEGQALIHKGHLLAFCTRMNAIRAFIHNGVIDADAVVNTFQSVQADTPQSVIDYPWQAVLKNGSEIVADFKANNCRGVMGTVHPGVHMINREHVCIAEGAVVMPGVVIDAENGPVWIDSGAKIMPNSVLEGPLYIGKNSVVKIGAKLYENSTIGPVCKVGGEVEESIIQGYSNKQHDGFLGHAYLGSWVNLGADTNNSDLKNNYGNITVMVNGQPVQTGERFVGLIMGDHSKCAINMAFNTGTVVGVSCNIFGSGMPPKLSPSFSWGGAEGLSVAPDKAKSVAQVVMTRRNKVFDDNSTALFDAVIALAREMETGTPL